MKTLDFLLLEPSLDWEKDLLIKVGMRVEKDIPIRESPRIAAGYMLSVLKKHGYRAQFISMAHQGVSVGSLLDHIKETRPSLIGMTAFTFQIPVVGKMAALIKKQFPHIPICVGGCHVTALPHKTLEEYTGIDFVVRGEVEEMLPDIVRNSGNRQELSKTKGVVLRGGTDACVLAVAEVDSIPFPAWEEIDLSRFPGTNPHGTKMELPMITGRGCPFQCIFCCRYLGNKCRRRSVDSVIAEITRNVNDFGCEAIAFLDDTFILNMNWTEEFFEKMSNTGLNKKVKWSCTTRVSDVSPALLAKMKSAGCYYIFYGFESANDAILKIAKKAINREQIRRAVEWTKQCGIVPAGSFIIGLPGDTEEGIWDTIEFGTQLDLYSITFPIATPFPGSELREMALRNDYGMTINPSDWSDYLANDLDKYGKTNIRVLESIDLPWGKRVELQKIGYDRNPKKKISEYVAGLTAGVV